MKRLKRFFRTRLPLGLVSDFLKQPLPGNVRWGHTFGSALLFLLVILALTGGTLLLYYVPTPDNAWTSLNSASEFLPLVAYIRSLHVWAATLLILISTLHILHVVITGAYKRPRELNWVFGVAAYLMIYAFLFTGRLLPWDQNGYWGTRFGLEMIGRLPLVGSLLQQVLQRGDEIGAYTLSSFFALHTFFLPGGMLVLVVLHLALLRFHGVADHPEPGQRGNRDFPFYPQQVFRNAMVAFVILWFLLTLSLVAPAILGQPADPADTTYDPRPEWYFLAHYELLRLFAGSEIIPIFVIPLLLIGAALLLPWLDRSEHRTWRKRKIVVAGVLLVFGLLYGAAAYSRNCHPGSAGSFAIGELPLPEDGVQDQMLRAREVLVQQRCVNCHRIQGYGGLQGPDLSQSGSKLDHQRLRTHILDPESLEPDTKMPAYRDRIPEEDLDAIIEYLSLMR